MWDIEGSEEYRLIHHSVFTQYSLYLLVWDFWSIEKEISDISCWLYNIQVSGWSFGTDSGVYCTDYSSLIQPKFG